jgi:hypothetical protein
LLWKINASLTGNHEISVHYASKTAPSLDLIIDGTKEGAIASSKMGRWANWNTGPTRLGKPMVKTFCLAGQ